jgi:hypothetical protein
MAGLTIPQLFTVRRTVSRPARLGDCCGVTGSSLFG